MCCLQTGSLHNHAVQGALRTAPSPSATLRSQEGHQKNGFNIIHRRRVPCSRPFSSGTHKGRKKAARCFVFFFQLWPPQVWVQGGPVPFKVKPPPFSSGFFKLKDGFARSQPPEVHAVVWGSACKGVARVAFNVKVLPCLFLLPFLWFPGVSTGQRAIG